MEEDKTTEASEQVQNDNEDTDIFLWANNLVQLKEELKIELFLINKNSVVYKTSRSKDLEMHLHSILIDPILEYVLEGADQGLVVRTFEEAEAEQMVLQKTKLINVAKAREVLSWLRTQEAEIEQFVEEEHDLKRIKGIIARVSHPEMEKPFYVAKVLPSSNVMKGNAGWLVRGGKFVPFDAEGALRIPTDNQILIVDQDIFVFNQTKLEQLFNYNAKKAAIAEKKVAEIQDNFKLSFEDGASLNTMVMEKKSLVNKLQKIDPSTIKQDELLNHAEELGIEMMTDNDGSIIIMDTRDLTKFVNLLNDDYYESPMTGMKYEIKSKKPLKLEEPDELKEALTAAVATPADQ
jgi:hypothetical protein